ncbi:MAG: hypothetical protein RR048_02350 [Oscillospiraceae bacterium]
MYKNLKTAIVKSIISFETALNSKVHSLKSSMENNTGGTVSSETFVWIVIVVAIGGALLKFFNTKYPELGNLVFGKLKDMLNS